MAKLRLKAVQTIIPGRFFSDLQQMTKISQIERLSSSKIYSFERASFYFEKDNV